MSERIGNFAYQYLRCVNGSSTCRKILRHGVSGFTSHQKEDVLQIFITLKYPSPRLALNLIPIILYGVLKIFLHFVDS
jgi:hypothetical protein